MAKSILAVDSCMSAPDSIDMVISACTRNRRVMVAAQVSHSKYMGVTVVVGAHSVLVVFWFFGFSGGIMCPSTSRVLALLYWCCIDHATTPLLHVM